VLVPSRISHIPIADQNFGTSRFLPLFPKSIHSDPFIGESTALTELFRSSCCDMCPRGYAMEGSVTNGRPFLVSSYSV